VAIRPDVGPFSFGGKPAQPTTEFHPTWKRTTVYHHNQDLEHAQQGRWLSAWLLSSSPTFVGLQRAALFFWSRIQPIGQVHVAHSLKHKKKLKQYRALLK
jgi:hypothetical protein